MADMKQIVYLTEAWSKRIIEPLGYKYEIRNTFSLFILFLVQVCLRIIRSFWGV